MKKFLERHSFLILLIFIVVGGFGFAYYALGYAVGTNFTLCTASATQPACYGTPYPTPTVNWTVVGTSNQSSYQAQFDQNALFNNVLIDSGEVNSTNKFYQVSQDDQVGVVEMRFNQTYYWRVRIRDNFGSLSNWVEADSSFKANLSCASDPTINPATMSVSVGSPATYCGGAAHYFAWTYSDTDSSTESRFEFQVDNNSDFNSPEVDRDYTGLSNPSPTVNNQVVTVSESPGSDQIGYNTTYYWRAKVYDDTGRDSGWVNGSAFTTETHRYPLIGLSWSPQSPSQDEDVLFVDQSTVYGGTTKSNWAWTFEDGAPAVSSSQNPTVQFASNGAKEVVLGMTDSDGFTCDNSANPGTVNVQFTLPDWREIIP